MKRIVKTAGSQEFIIEEFVNFREFVKVNDSRKHNSNITSDPTRGKNDRWHGGSYDEAIEMLCYGWHDEEKVKSIAETVKKVEKTLDVPKMSTKNDIVGYAPIVPLALQGVPQNMINSTRKPKKAKVVNLVVDIAVSAGTDVNALLDWGAKLVANILNLEKQGYRVRVWITDCFAGIDSTRKVHAYKVLIKNENQPFDIKRMMFPLVHTAMKRMLAFDWYERLPEAEYVSNYGKPLHHQEKRRKELIQKEIMGAEIQNAYFLCCMDDIEQGLKEIA